jgi:methylmalonyl-CoA decarboxylase subunit alpha
MTTNCQDPMKVELAERRTKALGMGGAVKLDQRRKAGLLNARERLDRLFDEGSLHELGLHATSHRTEDRDTTPADAKITAFGMIEGRKAAAISNDLTVKGATSSLINGRKIAHMKRTATDNGMPLIFLAESSGARMPDSMGAVAMGFGGQDPTQYCRARETPWVSAVLGPCFGSSVWYAVMSDFVVMRKGATLAVSSPRVTSLVVSETADLEDLGGWKLHSEVTGLADAVAATDEEAIDLVRRFLSYLPSHARAVPPSHTPKEAEPIDLDTIVPRERTKVYDVRKVIAGLADGGTVFPIKDRFARSVVTCLARIAGRTVGFIAPNPLFKGGALDPDACDKAAAFVVLCDSFNIPLVMLVDTPGFLVGLDGERKKAPARIMALMHAVQLATVPKISVITRKSYGQAYLNLGGGRNSDESAAWVSADVSFMDPHIGARIVHGVDPTHDVDAYERAVAAMCEDTSAYAIASAFGVHHVLLPSETRDFLIRALSFNERTATGGLSKRMLANWPTTL